MNTVAESPRMTVLVIGGGGREHAIVWKLAQSESVARIVAAPGNPGIATLAEIAAVTIDDPKSVADLALALSADLVVVGPEVPLAAGVADAVIEVGIPVFGPTRAAARVEWDKAFAKDFMTRHAIPTSRSATFTSAGRAAALRYVRDHELPVVVKANGLAAGKGVVVATSHDEALAAVDSMLSGESFGEAGTTIVVEEFLSGEEVSVFAICDGEDYVLLAPSQDHKRVGDGDTGPNTGGMGAYAPTPIMTDALLQVVRETIIERALRGMRNDGYPFIGCLFAGLMVDGNSARVVEFNSRFGDPETEVVLPLYRGDFGALLLAAALGKIASIVPGESRGVAATVVMASEGYPESYSTGRTIIGINEASHIDGVVVFQAGTRLQDGNLLTNGGRVLAVTAFDDEAALDVVVRRAYEAVELIHFDGAHYRHDIAYRALERTA